MTQPRRARKLLLLLIALPLALELAYLAAGNAALWLAPRLATRHSDVQLGFRAQTFVPGIVHVQDFRLRAEDRYVQWGLDVERGRVRVNLPALARRTLLIEETQASGVGFRLRRKRLPEEVASARPDDFPPIDGFGPVPLRDDAKHPQRPPLKDPWTLRMEQVSARAKELWIESDHYQGPATARGHWQMTFDDAVEVPEARLALEGGALSKRGAPLMEEVRAELDVVLASFKPREVQGMGIVDQLSAKGQVHGAVVEELDLSRLAGLEKPMKVAAAPGGTLDVDVELRGGTLHEGTQVRVALPEATTTVGALGLKGAVEATATVTGHQTFALRVDGRALRVAAPRFGLSVHARSASLETTATGTHLCDARPPRLARVKLSGATLDDLRALNRFIPEPAGLQLERGRGRVSANLRVDLQKGTASGRVGVTADRLRLSHRGRTLRGRVRVAARVRNVDAELERLRLDGSRISFDDMRLARTGADARPWSGTLSFPRATVDLHRKEIFRGRLQARFDDARPLFGVLVSELNVPRWARGVMTPRNVRADLDLTLGPKLVRVDALDAKVGRFALHGYVRLEQGDSRAVSQITLGGARVGLERVGRRTDVQTFAGRDWFDRKAVAAGRRSSGAAGRGLAAP